MDQGIIIVLVIIAVIAIIGFSIYARYKRRKELQEWATSRGFSFSSAHDSGFENRFPEFDCLRKGHRRYAYNVMEGQWTNRRFTGFDYHYETYSRDSKGRQQTHHHNFSAVVLGSEVPLKPLFIRAEGFFDKISEFVGFDDIDFESAEFSRKFFVKAQDKRWAYDVIHTRTMEFLLSQPRYTIQFDRLVVGAYRNSCFSVQEYEEAAKVIEGILDRLPNYLIQQQKEQLGSGN